MNIKPIKNDSDLDETLSRIDEIEDSVEGTPEYDELDVLSTLVEVYENIHYPIDFPTAIDAIKFCMW